MRVVLLAGFTAALAIARAAAAEPMLETRIPHRDGTGRATIVEVQPGVPGARAFVGGDERAAPEPGELSLPSPTTEATATPRARMSPAP